MSGSFQKQALFISHGGGPMPLLGDPGHAEMVVRLKEITQQIRKPSAILIVSAHWEERVPTITAAATPDLIYDYYGFPPESYQIQYPAPGEPELAGKVQQALASAGINSQLSDTRGYDHGVFIPLKIMYPDADIPCIQLSLNHNLNAEDHLAMGKALQALDYDNLLILGSGFSFHNMRAFFAPNTPEIRARNQAFEDWLLETCASTEMTEADRSDRFANWERAPEARFCHPREEHLLPLHVCYGWAGKAADKHWTANILNKNSGMFYWQV